MAHGVTIDEDPAIGKLLQLFAHIERLQLRIVSRNTHLQLGLGMSNGYEVLVSDEIECEVKVLSTYDVPTVYCIVCLEDAGVSELL